MTTPEERLDAAGQALGEVKPAAALDALARAAREELAKTPRARAWWLDGLVVLALNLVAGLGAAALLPWSNTQHASPTLEYAVGLGWLVVMAVGSTWWLRPGAPTSRWAVGALFVGASVLAVGNASGFDPGSPFFSVMRCAFAECGIAVVPLTVVVGLSLRFAARPSHVFVGTLTSAAGGALALHFHCGNGTLAHLLAFHLFPAVVLAAVAVKVRQALRPRSFVP
jgi:hypothetical protein